MAVRMALISMLMFPAASQAVITVPVDSDDGVHFADFNILEPGKSDEKYFDEGLGSAERELYEDEISAMKLGFSYFWDLLKGDFQAQKPVQILIVPYLSNDDNAYAFSLNYFESTENWIVINGNPKDHIFENIANQIYKKAKLKWTF